MTLSKSNINFIDPSGGDFKNDPHKGLKMNAVVFSEDNDADGDLHIQSNSFYDDAENADNALLPSRGCTAATSRVLLGSYCWSTL